ncbi:cutinase-domain-containing protein [Cladorrhinum sp. PSN332]|nr:cutinase-domain-containing protein [Cladorrhinum sp. PSN332]
MKEILSRAVTALAALLQPRDTLVWDGKCAAGIHIIVARGSTEAPGLGRAAPVANNATLLIPGSSIATVDYPATFENYFVSQATAASEFERLVLEHVEACPNTKIALIGYSQGAHALMDSICGGAADGYRVPENLTKALESQVVANILFGDPSHTAGAPWNSGTSNKTGLFARNNVTACEPFADRIRSYCDTGDVYCDLGNVSAVHGSYFATYSTDAAEFIAKQFEEVQLTPSGSNGTDTGSGSTTTQPTGGAPTETLAESGARAIARTSWMGVLAGVVGTVGFLGML